MPLDFLVPSILILGGGSFSRITEVLTRLRCKRPLIITDAFLASTGLAIRLRDAVVLAGMECSIFADTVPDPTTEVVDAGVRAFVEGRHDSLIGLGGGSPIDTAKAIGLLVSNGGRVRDYKVPSPIPNAGPPHIAVPTTAGTGSEVTRFTVITDSSSEEKMLIAGSSLMPSAAVVDYELTLSMPARLTADTGTDSLTHAIEAYVSRKANAFSDMFALRAMNILWNNLPVAFNEPGDRKAREAMSLGATLAGIAFSNSSVALVHGMSRPLGAFFHIPHGLSNGMLLPAVTSFSAPAAPARYAECARVMGICDSGTRDEDAAATLVRSIYRRNEDLKVPSLRSYGIEESRFLVLISTMAAQALASGSPQNNPRVPTADEIEQLYRDIWHNAGSN